MAVRESRNTNEVRRRSIKKRVAKSKKAAIEPKVEVQKESGFSFPDLFLKSPKELQASVHHIRTWSSQMRSTMSEIEQTLETLHNLLGLYERFQSSNKTKRALQSISKGGGKNKLPFSLLKTFNHVDFRQMVSLLNSPLMLALLEPGEESTSTPAHGEHEEYKKG